MLTPQQIELIQQSFAKVAPISDKAAAMFYDRLFEIAPETKIAFPRRYGRAGPQAHGHARRGRQRASQSRCNPAGGKRTCEAPCRLRRNGIPLHAGRSLWTLEKGLGSAWTPELAVAWTTTYTTLSGFMIGEAYGRGAAA